MIINQIKTFQINNNNYKFKILYKKILIKNKMYFQ